MVPHRASATPLVPAQAGTQTRYWIPAEFTLAQAGAVLDRWIWSGHSPLFVLGVLEQGRIAEGLGERQKAIDSYQFVVDVWRRADPELQSFVVEARNALARLRRE